MYAKTQNRKAERNAKYSDVKDLKGLKDFVVRVII